MPKAQGKRVSKPKSETQTNQRVYYSKSPLPRCMHAPPSAGVIPRSNAIPRKEIGPSVPFLSVHRSIPRALGPYYISNSYLLIAFTYHHLIINHRHDFSLPHQCRSYAPLIRHHARERRPSEATRPRPLGRSGISRGAAVEGFNLLNLTLTKQVLHNS
jgi:hypothetical protein